MKNVFSLAGYDFSGMVSGIVAEFGKQTYFVGCLFWMGSGFGFLEVWGWAEQD